MLTIIIADDEMGIVGLCKKLIRYPNVEIIGEASNGVELFEKIKKLHPNTVITDICMPGLTGIELIEKAKSVYPEINFIVMSGYTDFTYAQTLLRFGVWDYLLKPLDEQELNHTLEKLDNFVKEKQTEAQYYANMEENLQKSLEALRERYLRQVWKSGISYPIPQVGEEDVLDITDAKIQCLLFSADSNFSVVSKDADVMLRQADHIFEKIALKIEKNCRTVSVFSEHAIVAIYIILDRENADAKSQEYLKEIRDELREINSQNHLIHIASSASELLSGEEANICEIFRQAQTALKWRLEKRQSNMLLYTVEQEIKLRDTKGLKESKSARTLQNAVEKQDVDETCTIIRDIWKESDKYRSVLGYRYRLIEDMLECLNEALSKLPHIEGMTDILQTDIYRIVSNGYNPEEISSYFEKYVAVVFDKYRNYLSGKENSIVTQAKRYIARHYAQNITLEQLAKEACLTPTYFSKLFKQETGCGFLEYLQSVRIENAKTLLRDTKMRVRDIAETVGYKDLKYFNRVFFRETNVRPSEYRKFNT